MSVKQHIDELKNKIQYHNYRYYVLDRPEVTDAEYDALMRRLQALENENPELITPDSPTQRVGNAPAREFPKVPHTPPMLSLSNAMDESEVREFDTRNKKNLGMDGELEYVVEPKLDGLAVKIMYQAGTFLVGATRGDGSEGEDISQNLKTIRSIPLTLMSGADSSPPDTIEVRGEVVMKKSDFDKLNRTRAEQGEPLFANPRNSAAGSVRQLDCRITAQRPLDCFFYALGDQRAVDASTHSETLAGLKQMGFKVNQHIIVCSDIEESIRACKDIENRRNDFPYEIDGAVIKVNDLGFQEQLGSISRSPRWAIAYKFPPQQATTVVKNITVQIGRTGVLTPVAHLEPVRLSGVKIQNATLHNMDQLEKKDIRIGDTVLVQRAGDVIPEIIKAVESKRTGAEKKFSMPLTCPDPACGGSVVKSENEAVYRCDNPTCPSVVKECIRHFASRRAMNIEGLGEKLVAQLVDKHVISSVADLYFVSRATWQNLERMAEKSAQNIVEALEKSKQAGPARLLYALGIRHVGENTAQLLLDELGSIAAVQAAEKEQLLNIKGIGDEIAESIIDYFSQEHTAAILHHLREAGVSLSLQKAPGEMPLQNKTFVFTGTLKRLSRTQAQQKVAGLGGKTASSVTKKTDYVVVGDSAGSKYEKAKKLEIAVLTEEEFLTLISF